VFFVGDAAHVVPPSGSYGANTGIADAHNLAWKLAAVVRGQAGDTLLDTYEDERRPVAQVTLEQAMQLLHGRHEGTGNDATTIDDLTMIFGYRYNSAAILTETPALDGPVEDPRKPSGRPGLRAPHVWLDRAGTRLSTLDLFNGAFTLLVGPDGADWAAAAKTAAASFDVELQHPPHRRRAARPRRPVAGYIRHHEDRRDPHPTRRIPLIRPDGFVAWRASDLPQQPEHELQQALTHLLAPDARHKESADRCR
jgi:putative polyketide hydroxylase